MKFEKKIGDNLEIQVENLDSAFKFVPKLDSNGVLSYNELKDKPKLPSGGIETIEAEQIEIPTKLSQFTNDMGFLTQHQDISGKLNTSGGVASNLTVNGLISNGEIEVFGASPHIDFHFNNATNDYTSRIIENSKGILTFTGGITLGSPLPISSGGTGETQRAENWTFTANSSLVTNLSQTCYYYPYLHICFIRLYFKLATALNASTTRQILTIPAGRTPSYAHALSGYTTAGALSVRASVNNGIQIHCTGAVATTHDIYISGFWYA